MTQRSRIVWWLVGLWAMAFQFYLSSIPGDELAAPAFELSDKLFHALAYAAIAGALRMALDRPRGLTRLGKRARTAIAVGVGVAYGIFDELHQLYVPHRDASISDLVADTLGAVIGATVAVALLYRRRRDADPQVPGSDADARPGRVRRRDRDGDR